MHANTVTAIVKALMKMRDRRYTINISTGKKVIIYCFFQILVLIFICFSIAACYNLPLRPYPLTQRESPVSKKTDQKEPISLRTSFQRELTSASPFLWYFDDWNDVPYTKELIEQAWNYKLVLVHTTNSNILPEQILTIKKGRDGKINTMDDVYCIGYVSVGEDIRTDNIHQQKPAVGDGRGPVYWNYDKDELVYQNNGYASYYLDDRDKDGQPDRNWQYSGCYADPGNSEYQELLRYGKKDTDGFSGIEELYEVYHCDGVFLDTLDVVNPNSWGFPFYFEWTASGGKDFIQELRSWYPDKLIALNRTLVYFDPNQHQENGTSYLGTWGRSVAEAIDLLIFEGFYWPGDEKRNRYYWAPKVNAEADRNNGFTILSLDYVGDAQIDIDGNFSDWEEFSILKEGVEKLDDVLIWSKGSNTINETIDCENPSIDITNLWMANNADNSQLFMRIDFAAPIDLKNCNYYIFFDTDQDRETGFRNVANGVFGADYMVYDGDNENFHLYQHSGNQISWKWDWLGTLPSATGPIYPSETLAQVETGLELSIPNTLLEESNRFDEALHITVFTEDPRISPYIVDNAPDNPATDFYIFHERTKALGFQETLLRQGWLSYNKPFKDGSTGNYIDPSSLQYTDTIDSDPPVWDSTAAAPGVVSPSEPVARVGIQEAEPGDQTITVRWDVARDQTRPVNYVIYYSTELPFNLNEAVCIDPANTVKAGKNYYSGTGHRIDFPNGITAQEGYYSELAGEGVYPYEYTITGLQNDKTYYCMVRARDSAVPMHEDTNTMYLAATPRSANQTHIGRSDLITIDADFADWEFITPLDFSPGESANTPGVPGTIDIVDIYAVDDSVWLYFAITFSSSILINSEGITYSILLDTDNQNSSGYAGPYLPFYPWAIGADYLWENGKLYAHSLLNNYRVWNWELLDNQAPVKTINQKKDTEPILGISHFAVDKNKIELSIRKTALGLRNEKEIKLVCIASQLQEQPNSENSSLLRDSAPNDFFSHSYTYQFSTMLERIE